MALLGACANGGGAAPPVSMDIPFVSLEEVQRDIDQRRALLVQSLENPSQCQQCQSLNGRFLLFSEMHTGLHAVKADVSIQHQTWMTVLLSDEVSDAIWDAERARSQGGVDYICVCSGISVTSELGTYFRITSASIIPRN